jgi:hypothetical protein
MLKSANEGSNAVAEYVSGSMEEFALLMTQRAKELGAENTQFTNSNGLDDDGHYTTAYDMAVITNKAIEDPRFLTIWGAYQHILDATNLQPESRIFINNNRLLTQGPMPYEGILGGKTGFTTPSKNTLVEVARRQDRTLICVVLQAPDLLTSYQDAVMLLDYGFEHFRPVTYEDGEYEASYTYLLHNDLTPEQVAVLYGEPAVNEDGSASVSVTVSLPPGNADLMYPDIAGLTLTSPPPETPALPEESGAGFFETPPFSWVAGLFSLVGLLFTRLMWLIDLLPGFLALMIKLILAVVALLFVLACFFRTRRWLRRRKRLLYKKKMEAMRKAYREQQSYWC